MESIYYALNPWWEGKEFESGINRQTYVGRLSDFIGRKQIEVMIGSRRVGKTTLLKQLIKEFLQRGEDPKSVFYLALDHPALSGKTLSHHLKDMRKFFLHDRQKRLYLFLDEVQESPNWETELKAIYDLEPLKIFCTGSTSSLIKSQGGKLTGRQIVTMVYPLSFPEFILFRGELPSSAEDYKYEHLAEEYLQVGGYPEQVLHPSVEYMGNLLEDILARDLIRLFPIKKPFVLKDLLRLIASSAGSRTSFHKLSRVLDLTVDTVKEYISYLESAFLVSSLEKWTTSWSEKVYAAKKIYFWDTGLKTLLTGSGDKGAGAESAVYMELKRRDIGCGYYAESEREIDFVTGTTKNPRPIEVKYLTSFDWNDKRLAGVKLFLRRYPQTKEVVIVSQNVEAEENVRNHRIQVVPIWKFLLRSANYI